MRCLLLAAILFIHFTPLFSQIRLDIVPPDKQIITPDYQIVGVLDSTTTSLIGKVRVSGVLESVRLNKSIRNYFTTLLDQSITKKADPTKILLVIRKLAVSEKSEDNYQAGRLTLEVAFLSLRNADTTFLTKTVARIGYQRTEGGSPTKNLEKLITNNLFTTINFFNGWLEINRSIVPAFAVASKITTMPPYGANDADTIYYPTRRVIWSDFTGSPAFGSDRFAAAIFVSIGYALEMTVRSQVILANFTPKVYMVKGLSWVRTANQNSYSLQHEQLHFDIAQIAMNRYVERVKTINESTPEDVQSRVHYEYLEAFREMNRLQEAYDDETGHGTDVAAQNRWEAQIAAWLKE